MNDGIMSLYQVIEFPFRPRRRRLPPPRRRRPRRCRASCGVVAPPSAGCRAAALRRFLRWCRFKSAPSGGLRGWAPTRPPLLHRRVAAQKLKMFALSSGGGSFCRRRFSSSPWPSLAAARSAGRARSRAGGVPPAAPAPSSAACGWRGAPLAQGRCKPLRGPCARVCAALCASSPPPLLARAAAALRGVLACLRLGSRSSGGGLAGPPLPPLRASLRFRSLGGALPRGLAPAPFSASGPRREKVFCRRCGGDGEKPLRRLICADSGSAQRACARLFIAESYPSERQPRCFLSSQDKTSAQALSY